MINEKQIKAEFRKKAQQKPELYYPVDFLKKEGFMRKRCSKCGNYFWTKDPERDVCGEPACIGGYKFIGEQNTKVKLDFIDSWKLFSKIFKKLGYEPIKRYPVVARWRDDMEFVIASIADFQPYVVNGLVEPPANPLVIPQFCLRFPDIDNVGYTGRHYTGFVMIGQHAFVPKQEYDKDKYLSDIYYWLSKGMGIKEEEIIFHEDAWAGGGNLGPSMEFFSKGLEIGNQVYMQYDITTGEIKDLKINVLDMGMGQERVAWFSHGTETSYEANFPTVMKHLYKETGIKPNYDIIRKFLPYSALLNIDEVDDINKVWSEIAQKTGIPLEELKQAIEPVAALYAIAEHTRTLLVAISDGAIPSNVSGGYNLRVIARRSFDFINKFGFNINIHNVFEEHAHYLKPQYPELSENLENVKKIMDIEYQKYLKTKEKSKQIIRSLKGKTITIDKLVELYDSQGISPEMLVEEGIIDRIPDNFYGYVAQKHEQSEAIAKAKTKKNISLPLDDVADTEILYWGDWKLTEFEGKILKVIDNKYVVLDRTAFYPTSGGQLHDTGIMIANNKNYKVIDVFKQDTKVVHVLENAEGLKPGTKIKGIIDFERRKQLTQHHTSTHILNDAAKKVLGSHIWQAGAEKTPEKARLDVTHYELPSWEEIQKIEALANKTIQEGHEVKKMVIERNKAEQLYGFRIYQGGAPPGKYIRIVEVGDDVEACGGTHLNNSLEAGVLKIIDVKKLQDGMIRFEFVAGKRAIEVIQEHDNYLHELSKQFNVAYKDIPKTALKFFEEWKAQRKQLEKLKEQLMSQYIEMANNNIQEHNGLLYASIDVQFDDKKDLMRLAQTILNKNKDLDFVLVMGKGTGVIITKHKNLNLEEILAQIITKPLSSIKGSPTMKFFEYTQ